MIGSVPPESAINAQDLLFDADFYFNKYPDLQAAFGHDNAKLLNHWKTYGIKEGRAGSEALDLTYYRGKYPDLQAAFGDDFTRYYNHVFEYGIKEWRSTSATYDPAVYRSAYPYLTSLSPLQLVWHYLNVGRKQGMIAYMGFAQFGTPAVSSDPHELMFDADFYFNKYPDLQAAFGHDNAKLLNHWKTYGIKEGRACSDVLDLTYYRGKYPDLQQAFGDDFTRYYNHIFEYGINEYRSTSPSYDPAVYQKRYGLQGFTPIQLMQHFMAFGRFRHMVGI